MIIISFYSVNRDDIFRFFFVLKIILLVNSVFCKKKILKYSFVIYIKIFISWLTKYSDFYFKYDDNHTSYLKFISILQKKKIKSSFQDDFFTSFFYHFIIMFLVFCLFQIFFCRILTWQSISFFHIFVFFSTNSYYCCLCIDF